MRFRTREPEEPSVNLTPLIDVVFLLLIFFMVSTTFQREAELEIQLPEASGEPREEAPKELEVAIDAQGRYFVDRQALANTRLATLVRALEQAVREGGRERPVVILADGRTPHEAVIRALDAARRVGLYRITFATREPEEGAEAGTR
ncbi:ExbD/TolR family protein [Inmirania thermothiophila]|uniref:Biopolymer transport protein ExbD n=1 Tax=Inmirania thermothiophila TaxID=1750597 RepID=A0A3N1Y4V5_9GAMM|nr:biopolymer transporter ExbD [Inmirania thermothiophila]ROR32652.1 biopolymer transport protein ExbD [Inmirania thermothiophila]